MKQRSGSSLLPLHLKCEMTQIIFPFISYKKSIATVCTYTFNPIFAQQCCCFKSNERKARREISSLMSASAVK